MFKEGIVGKNIGVKIFCNSDFVSLEENVDQWLGKCRYRVFDVLYQHAITSIHVPQFQPEVKTQFSMAIVYGKTQKELRKVTKL